MRKKLLLLSVVISFSFTASGGGVPTFDAVANATALQQWVEKLQQWQQTVSHYQNQINVANDQLNTVRGIRDNIKNFNLNALINNINAIDGLIPNYDSIVNGRWNGEAETLAQKLGINDKCLGKSIDINNLCKSENMNLATNYIATEKVNSQVNEIIKQIRVLSGEVATSNDIKTTADINNKIMMYNEQLEILDKKLSIAQRQYETNQKLIDSQREIAIKNLNSAPSDASFRHFQDLLKSRNKNKSKSNFDGF